MVTSRHLPLYFHMQLQGQRWSRSRATEAGGRSPSQSHTGYHLRAAWGDRCKSAALSSRGGKQRRAGQTEGNKVGPAIEKAAAPSTPEQSEARGQPSFLPVLSQAPSRPQLFAPPPPTSEASIGPNIKCNASGPGCRSLIGRYERSENGLGSLLVEVVVAFLPESFYWLERLRTASRTATEVAAGRW